MDVTEAKELARKHLSKLIELEVTAFSGDYEFPHEEYYIFSYKTPGQLPYVGGSPAIAVRKSDGQIRNLGRIGE